VETASISYRVADFLKKHAPFHAVDDGDLLKLTAQGRVKFHEPNEYILWQGEPHKVHVFVIQQGTVSLWDEAGPSAELRDVRGPGDMLGLERYNSARSCAHSARSESDVVLYAFPADDFETCVLKYPHASQYVAAEGRVTPDYQPGGERREPHSLFVHDLVGGKPIVFCHAHESIAAAAGRLLATRGMALAVRDAEGRVCGVLTADTVLNWVAAGGGDAGQPVEHLTRSAPAVVRPDASAADAVLAMGTAGADVLAITADGAADAPFQALVTPGDLGSLFGDHPAALLREIRAAASFQELRELNHRSRAFLLKFLTGAASVEWLARFAHVIDVAIVIRINALIAAEPMPGCWCFGSSSGRAESLTALAPHLLVILEDKEDRGRRAGAAAVPPGDRRAPGVRLPSSPRPAARAGLSCGVRERVEGALSKLGDGPHHAADLPRAGAIRLALRVRPPLVVAGRRSRRDRLGGYRFSARPRQRLSRQSPAAHVLPGCRSRHRG
jgi:signal-transduction protein with cAMP-binding, CBS, and nucleotidyltransferase domain